MEGATYRERQQLMVIDDVRTREAANAVLGSASS